MTRTPDRKKGDTIKDAMAVPALIMALLFPVIGVIAVFLLLRGHDLPGGGFVAGVTMAVAFILQYMARGTIWVEARCTSCPCAGWVSACSWRAAPGRPHGSSGARS